MTASRQIGGLTAQSVHGSVGMDSRPASHAAGPAAAAFMRYLRPPVSCTDNFTSSGDCVCQWLESFASIKLEVCIRL